MRLAALFLPLVAACASAAADPGPATPPPRPARGEKPARVVVEVAGFRSATGKALIALFAAPDGFPDGKRASLRRPVAIKKLAARTVFDGLGPGTYAVAVLHDEDGDLAMATGLLGIPEEGYAASNDARGRFGPPRWVDAKFHLASGAAMVQKIHLVYP